MYNTEYFYGGYGERQKKHLLITDIDIERIKRLVSSRAESAYYNPQLIWKLDDNMHLNINIEELSRLFVCMQFITMIGKPSQFVLNKHNIKDHHMGLLRGLYLEFDEDIIGMGYKRPFGNSHVLGDVKDQITRYNGLSPLEDLKRHNEDECYEPAQKVLEEFINFLEDFFKDFEMPHHSFIFEPNKGAYSSLSDKWGHVISRSHRAHSYLHEWSVDPAELRDKKIEKLLN